MKHPSLVRLFALLLLTHLLAVPAVISGAQVEVVTTVTPNPFYNCNGTLTVNTEITHNGFGPDWFVQQIPPGCTLVLGPQTCNSPFPVLPWFFVDDTGIQSVLYMLVGPVTACEVTMTVTIPCSATPNDNNLFSVFYPTYPIYTLGDTGHANPMVPSTTDFLAPDAPFLAVPSRMLILNFKDDAGNPIPSAPSGGDLCPPPQKLLVSGTPQHRYFDLSVANGVVKGFTYTHGPESEIMLIGSLKFWIGGIGGTQVFPTGSGSGPYIFNQIYLSDLSTGLFPGGMVYGATISVEETFKVFQCSPKPDNDKTSFNVIVDCPESPAMDHGCNSITEERGILVEATPSGITPKISFNPPPLENPSPVGYFCAVTPADIVVSFHNPAHGISSTATGPCPAGDDMAIGSGVKSLKTFTFPMNQSVFFGGIPLNSICFVGLDANGLPTTAQFPLSSFPSSPWPFYEYSGAAGLAPSVLNPAGVPPYHVVLHFDQLLGGQPMGAGGPLENGFIPEGLGNSANDIHNELKEEHGFAIVFKATMFDCANALFYNGLGFDDPNKPGMDYMFFGSGGTVFDLQYCDMCGTMQHQQIDYGNLHTDFTVASDSIAGCLTCTPNAGLPDVEPGDCALVSFEWAASSSDPIPNPFKFYGYGTPSLYFNCVVTYKVKLTVSDYYTLDLNTPTYYPSPDRGNVIGAIQLTAPTISGPTLFPDGLYYNCYTYDLPATAYTGHIDMKVTLTDCPEDEGAFDLFTATILATCDGCANDACANTIADINAQLFHQCGDCLGGPEPQRTTNFLFHRLSFGTDEATKSVQVSELTPNITTNRGYACHQLKFVCQGTVQPNPNNHLSFRMDYSPGTPGSQLQFFEFIDASLTWDDGSSGPQTIPFTVADISRVFVNSTATWPNQDPADPPPWEMFVNFTDPAHAGSGPYSDFLDDIRSISSTIPVLLEFCLTVKIRPMEPVNPKFMAGRYPLMLTGQFWGTSDLGSQPGGLMSCEPYHAYFMVLGVKAVPYFQIFPSQAEGVCMRAFQFGTYEVGGLPNFNEFKSEHQEICHWPDQIKLGLLPAGAKFMSATITDVADPNWYPPNASYTVINSGTPTTPIFTGFTHSTGFPQMWPTNDRRGPAMNLRIDGIMRNDCPILVNTDVELDFQFTNHVYTLDTDCRSVHLSPDILVYGEAYPGIIPDPDLSLTANVSPFSISTIPACITTVEIEFSPWIGATAENVWVQVLPSSGITVDNVYVNSGAAVPKLGDFFQIGSVVAGPLSAAQLKFDVTFPTCSPGTIFPIDLRYGYSCAGMMMGLATDPAPCVDKTKTIYAYLEKSGLFMNVTPLGNGGVLCGPEMYEAQVFSTELGAVVNPQFKLIKNGNTTVSPTVTYITSSGQTGTLPAPIISTSTLCVWDINAFPINSGGVDNILPPFPFWIKLKFTVTDSCTAGEKLEFCVNGQNLCQGVLTGIPIIPVILPLIDSTGPTFMNCPTAAINLGCNPTVLPSCAMVQALVTTLGITAYDACSGNIPLGPGDCSPGSVVPNGCLRSQDFTITATDACLKSATCVVTYTWKIDIDKPVLSDCPPALTDLGCNPAILPDCTTVLTGVIANDVCDGVLTPTCAAGAVLMNGCLRSQIFTVTATDSCGNFEICTATYTWKDDTTPPGLCVTPITTVTVAGNKTDNFVGPEPASPSAGLLLRLALAGKTAKGFDDCTADRVVAHTFASLPPCITAATLTVRLKPCGNSCIDDTIGLSFTDANGVPQASASWTGYVGSQGNPPPALVTGDWCSFTAGQTVTLDLAALPASGGTSSLLTLMKVNGFLDFTCENDSSVDYLELTIVSCCCDNQVIDLGCNPTPPTCADAVAALTVIDNWDGALVPSCVPGNVVFNGCLRSQTFTLTAIDSCLNSASCTVTYNWTVDIDKPVFNGCPTAAIDLGCNPTVLPTCAMVAALNITASDVCSGNITPVCVPGPVVPTGCLRSQTFTLTATDACLNSETCLVIYNWTIDTAKPVFNGCPTAPIDLGCNPVTLPSCAMVAALGITASDVCSGSITPVCTFGSVQVNGCMRSQTFTLTATDACGNSETCLVTYNWKIDTDKPVITGCPTATIDLNCSPATLPDCTMAATGVTANDVCDGPLPLVCNPGPVQQNGNNYSQTFILTATDACLNSETCTVNYIWRVNCTNCCDNCVADQNGNYPVSITVPIVVGFNFLANPLCHGMDNLIGDVLGNQPLPDVTVYLFDKPSQMYVVNDYIAGSWTDPNMVLEPGVGFILFNSDPSLLFLTFTGCEPLTNCKPCAPTNVFCLVGGIGSANPVYYSNLFDCPPVCGTHVYRYDPSVLGNYKDYFYDDLNGWQPTEPILNPGESVFIRVEYDADCCWDLRCPTNIVVDCDGEAGAFVNFVPPIATNHCCPGPVFVSCDWASGWFPIGVTTVTCTAYDACTNFTSCCFTVTVRGHGYDKWKWSRQTESALSAVPTPDSGKSVAVDKKGNVFVTGSYIGQMIFHDPVTTTIVQTLNGFSDVDIYLAKYNAAGDLQWAVRAGGPGQDAGYGVAVDDKGNAYVTGAFEIAAMFESYPGTFAFNLISAGSRDIFVAKYDPAGKCLWATREGGTGNDRGAGIAVTPNGQNVFVTGDWGSASGLNVQSFVLPVSGAGVVGTRVVSFPTVPDPGQFARGRAIALDNIGRPYVTGVYAGATTFAPLSVPTLGVGERIFVTKFDGSLTCLNTKHSGFLSFSPSASGSHDPTGIAIDPSGQFCYVTANFIGTANFGGNVIVTDSKNVVSSAQLHDFLILKMRTVNLGPVWVIKGGGNLADEEQTRGIAVDPAGHPCVTGFLHPNALNNGVNEGRTVIVKSYDRVTGALRWSRDANDGFVAPNQPQDVGNGIAVDMAGCVHVTGDFTEDLGFEPPVPTLLNAALFTVRSMFVGKLCPTCGCEDVNHNLSTGLDNANGTLTSNGQADDCWVITGKPAGAGGGTPPFQAVVITPPFGSWQPPLPGSEWISVSPSSGPAPNGLYTNRYCFCLEAGFQNAVLDLLLRADDRVVAVTLNGISICVGCPGGAFNSATPLHVVTATQSHFVAGTNCLEIIVEDSGGVAVGLNVAGTIKANKGRCCARICGMKFHDLNHNGIKDPLEPGVAGWTILVKDLSGNVVASAVTDATGNYCVDVAEPPAGGSINYIVEEVQHSPYWVQTVGNVGLTVTGPFTYGPVNFGNTCAGPQSTRTYWRGFQDNCKFPYEFASKHWCLNSYAPFLPWKNFDDPTPSRHVGFSFGGLPPNIASAFLTVKMSPFAAASPANDTINLGWNRHNTASTCAGPVTWAWTGNIGAIGVPSVAFPPVAGNWDFEPKTTFTLNLANLAVGGGTMLGKIATDRFLDVMIENDTTVDWARLELTFCNPVPVFQGLLVSPLGEAELLFETNGSLKVSHLGTNGLDGVSIELGQADGWWGRVSIPTFSSGTGKDNVAGSLQSAMIGSVNGVEESVIGRLRIAGTGASTALMVDYSSVGSTNSLVECYDASGSVIGTLQIANNTPIGIGSSGVDFIGWACGPGQMIVNHDLMGQRYVMVAPLNGTENVFVGFPDGIQVIGSGGQSIDGVHAVSVSTIAVAATREFVSHITLQTAGVESFELTDELVRKFGVFFRPLGDAALDFNNGVAAYNLNTNGGSGVSVELGRAQSAAMDLTLSDPDSPMLPGAGFEARWVGSFNGAPNHDLGTLAATWSCGTNDCYSANFSAIGSPTVRVQVWSNGVMLADFAGQSTNAGWADSSPHSVAWLGTAAPGGSLGWPQLTRIMAGGSEFLADEVRLLAEGAGTVDYVSGLTLLAEQMEELTVIDVQTVPLLGPVITQQPASLSVVENHPATFTVTASGAGLAYQWFKNAAPIAGATNSSLTLPIASLADNGSTFAVVVQNPSGSVTSVVVTLTVTPDTTGPRLVSATGDASMTRVIVRFDELINPISAEPFSFSISGGLNVQAATMGPDGRSVILETDPQAQNMLYTVTVSDVTDLANNLISPNPTNATFRSFVFSTGFVLFETYNSSGNALSNLTSHPSFPNSPRERLFMPSFDTRTVYPDDSHDHYGARITGYFMPPTSGDWIFYLKAAAASACFSLSPDGDPANAISIVESSGCCGEFSDHASAPQPLIAGHHYFIMGLYQAETGPDYYQVAAKLNGDPTPPNNLRPISGSHLGTYVDATCAQISITQQPSDASAVAGCGGACFSVGAAGTNCVGAALAYQWQRNSGAGFVDVPGANGATYCTVATLAANGHQFRVNLRVPGASVISASATLTVVPGVPAITCPGNILTNIPGSNVVVNYPNPTVPPGTLPNCAPPSGSVFPLGTTLVTCTTISPCGSNSCTFTVTVAHPPVLMSYNIPVVAGFNLIANQLDRGSNTLNEIMPNVPVGTVLYKFNNSNQTWQVARIAGIGDWDDGFLTLNPGEGAYLESPTNFTLTISGYPHTPALPVNIPPAQCYLLSRQTNGPGNYDNIVGTVPADQTAVYRYVAGQGYMASTYDLSGVGGWDPFEPVADVGEPLWICPPGALPPLPVAPVITQQPASQSVRAGSNVTFMVTATGTAPLTYQWRYIADGTAIDAVIAGATSPTLTLSNVQPAQAGLYRVVVSNLFGSTTSLPATLTVLHDPFFTLHPVSQELVAGATVVLSASVTNTATLPIGYRLRRNNALLSPTNPAAYVTLSNRTVFFALSGTNTMLPWTNYSIVATNIARPGGLVSSNAILTYIPDSDGDGLPDSWETNHFGSTTNANAGADDDGDGMTNWEEYIAGTDPNNIASFLRIELPFIGSAYTLQIGAVSNRTYTVQSSDVLNVGPWTKLWDIPAHPTNRVVTVIDPAPSPTSRFYRVGTPRQP